METTNIKGIKVELNTGYDMVAIAVPLPHRTDFGLMVICRNKRDGSIRQVPTNLSIDSDSHECVATAIERLCKLHYFDDLESFEADQIELAYS